MCRLKCDRPAADATPAASLAVGIRAPRRLARRLLGGFGRWALVAAVLGANMPRAARALNWQAGDGFRWAELSLPRDGKTGFTRMPLSATGIDFTNLLAEQKSLTNRIYLNGSGVAAGDVDGDGWCDLYFCGLDGGNRLYRNLGNWKFQDITDAAGVRCPRLDCTGAVLADIDGDGDLDLIVTTVGHGTLCFLNDGKGHFTEATRAFGLNSHKGGMSMALADIDGDGYLDLYVANYRTSALMDMPNARLTLRVVNHKQVVERLNGRPVTEPDLANRFRVNPEGGVDENGQEDDLYRNQGGTNFVRVPFTGGAFLDEDGRPLATAPMDWGLSAMFRDLNGDGAPDLYVCNDFDSVDRLWINDGAGRFRAAPRLALRHTSLFSMGVDFADINRDGLDDFLVVDMLDRDHARRMNTMPDRNLRAPRIGEIDDRPQYSQTTLFLNRGDGTFAEIARLSGVEASDWAWCPVFLDVDLDGWEDLLITNGQERNGRDLDVIEKLRALRAGKRLSDAEIFEARRAFPRLDAPNLAFRNRGDLTFEEVGAKWGFDLRGVSQGMALADLDNDGDLDVVVNNLNAPAAVYRNDTIAPRIAVRLKGLPPNTRGIGAKITVFGGPVPIQSQEMIAGGRYLSSDDAMRMFAAGTMTNELRIEVTWRSGKQSVVNGARPNRIYEVAEAGATLRRLRPKPAAGQTFENVSALIQHTHRETAFDDFAWQPLLPNRLSQLGPGVTWFDVDGDGWDDLIIGSGRGGQLAVCRNDGHGGFERWTAPPLTESVLRDQTTVLGWRSATNGTVLWAGSANYEDGSAAGPSVRGYDLAGKMMDDTLPGQASSTGPLAMADVDGDGILDLFVGGRVVPGRYPEASSSMLLHGTGTTFVQDEENTKRLAQAGLVSGAVFSDLDGDGWPDLVLACEWGPVRIFHNDHGRLTEWNPPVRLPGTLDPRPSTLNQLTGWWNGVATGDFDGDGKPDIVASNWGRNTPYESYRSRPLRLYAGDLNDDGTIGLVEAHFDRPMNKYVPTRTLEAMAQALPWLVAQYPSHRAYGLAGVEEVLQGRLAHARILEANWFETTLFLNRGDHFEARPLPIEAQFAPAFGVCVGDFDGDGNEDVFLSQNFFATAAGTPRYDGGRGLWLRGDGRGALAAVSDSASGVEVYGEQRGCALADYDGDGRIDLAVAQNGASTQLYHNVGGKPGLRVRLRGPAGNPSGIGAAVRLQFGDAWGPAREVRAGGGYWSEDSTVQVLGTPQAPTRIWVRWPGGRTTSAVSPAGAKEIAVDVSGAVSRTR